MESTLVFLLVAMAMALPFLLFILKHLTSFLFWLYILFLRRPKDLQGYGSWALVTGPTDGIGRALTFELARKGLNLVLVGRNPDKLSSMSAKLLLEFPGIQVEVIRIDFTEGNGLGSEGTLRIREAAERLDIGVVVNNAGAGNTSPLLFHEMEEEMVREMVKVNVAGLTMVTWAVLPKMLESGRGAIVNIGSGTTVTIPSHPFFATYVGTKGYVELFSRTLHVECKRFGIDVQCQLPLYVKTKMVPYAKQTSIFAPSPEKYARAAVRRIGYEAVCMPYWSHAVQRWLSRFVPDAILDALRFRSGMNIRKAMEEELSILSMYRSKQQQ